MIPSVKPTRAAAATAVPCPGRSNGDRGLRRPRQPPLAPRAPRQLPVLLQAYQDLRIARTTNAQNQSRLNQEIFHLPDGPEQEQRDADMRKAAEYELRGAGALSEGSANQWADETKSRIQFGYDADEVAEEWWRDGGEEKLRASGRAEVRVDRGTVAASRSRL